MAKDTKNLQMDQFIKEIMFRENRKAVAAMSGKMDNSTKDNGSTDSNMVQESGVELKEIRILASGARVAQMAMECILGPTVIDTRDSSKTV